MVVVAVAHPARGRYLFTCSPRIGQAAIASQIPCHKDQLRRSAVRQTNGVHCREVGTPYM